MSAQITIIGNLTRDPELKFLGNDSTVVKLSVAVNRRVKGKNGEFTESTSFFNVGAFGTLAENTADSLHQGNRVIVTGRIEQRTWDKEDGTKGTAVEIVAEAIGPDLRWNNADVKLGRGGKSPAPKGNTTPYTGEDAF
jgi:single-strand DNA-binding protein